MEEEIIPFNQEEARSKQQKATVFPVSTVWRLGGLGDLFKQRAKLAPELWLLRFSACRLRAHRSVQ